MDTILKTSVWQQFGAAVDTLDDALNLCPAPLWTAILWDDSEDVRYGQFWFIAYHTLFWLDLFLTGSMEGFKPPPPFVRGKLPENPYSKEDVHAYLRQCRQKSHATIEALTDAQAYQICTFEWMEPTFLELQLYSMRHIQEHA
ncbi:MAG: DinB family protein, partial [Chloroflexota bacterium]